MRRGEPRTLLRPAVGLGPAGPAPGPREGGGSPCAIEVTALSATGDRLVDTPEVRLGGAGLTCALCGIDAASDTAERSLPGRIPETSVFQELRLPASRHQDSLALLHFRDRNGTGMDIVIEHGARVPVVVAEVGTTDTGTSGEFGGMRKLRTAGRTRCAGSVGPYVGEMAVHFGAGMCAVSLHVLRERR